MAHTDRAFIDPQGEVERVLARFAQKGISNSNKPVLAINQAAMMKAQNGGFPKHLYHASLDPKVVLNEDQEMGLRELGYGDGYIRRDWPRFVFRRNMDPKFKADDFVESRQVANQASLDRLERERRPDTAVGKWCFEYCDVPAIAEKALEDPQVTIARLQGQLAEVEANRATPSVDKGKK